MLFERCRRLCAVQYTIPPKTRQPHNNRNPRQTKQTKQRSRSAGPLPATCCPRSRRPSLTSPVMMLMPFTPRSTSCACPRSCASRATRYVVLGVCAVRLGGGGVGVGVLKDMGAAQNTALRQSRHHTPTQQPTPAPTPRTKTHDPSKQSNTTK